MNSLFKPMGAICLLLILVLMFAFYIIPVTRVIAAKIDQVNTIHLVPNEMTE